MELEFVAGKCLTKDHDDRPESAKEIAKELRTLAEKLRSGRSTILRTAAVPAAVPANLTAAHTVNPAAALPPNSVIVGKRRLQTAYGAAVLLAAALLAVSAAYFTAPAPAQPVVEFSLALPDGAGPSPLSISPDGRHLVLWSRQGPLRVRSLASEEWRELAGTEGALYPFWSPGSDEIGFFAEGRLKKAALAGGPAQTIAEAPAGRGGSWGRDGTIVFAPDPYGAIQRVAEAGGEPVVVTAGGGNLARRFPQLLPDGKHFLYTANGPGADTESAGIFLASLDGDVQRRLLPDASNAVFAPAAPEGEQGFLFFVREGTLMAQPFDAAGLELTGGAAAAVI
jgi:hypothetical protein